MTVHTVRGEENVTGVGTVATGLGEVAGIVPAAYQGINHLAGGNSSAYTIYRAGLNNMWKDVGAVLYWMNGAMPGRMAPTVKTISKHLPRDGRALRRQLEKLAADGLVRLIAREKSGVWYLILNLPLIAKSPKPRAERQLTLPLEWQEPVDYFDIDAWMRQHADEMPRGQMSASPETTRTNVREQTPADKCPQPADKCPPVETPEAVRTSERSAPEEQPPSDNCPTAPHVHSPLQYSKQPLPSSMMKHDHGGTRLPSDPRAGDWREKLANATRQEGTFFRREVLQECFRRNMELAIETATQQAPDPIVFEAMLAELCQMQKVTLTQANILSPPKPGHEEKTTGDVLYERIGRGLLLRAIEPLQIANLLVETIGTAKSKKGFRVSAGAFYIGIAKNKFRDVGRVLCNPKTPQDGADPDTSAETGEPWEP